MAKARISIGTWAYLFNQETPTNDFHVILHKLQDLGYDGVELGSFGPHPTPATHPTKASRAKLKKEIVEGRAWNREEVTREEASRRFEAEGEPYKVELVDSADGAISLYTQGDFTDLCRGPHLQNTKPIKAVKLTGLAGAYWRGDEQLFGLKPMNCPGHCLVYASRSRSYRELPVRLAEAGTLHRNEPSGTLHGLLRVRHVTQDDGHTYCLAEQIEDEVGNCLEHAFYLYGLLDLTMRVELSLRPDNKLGSDEDWDVAEEALRNALRHREIEFEEMPGEGAFYGPKIDVHMEDSLGRSWQLGTVQLDFQMPQRFGLTYQAADNEQKTPAMIHRALFGSMERFIGILIEHYGGEFPFWLAPVQLRVLPVGEDHREAASLLARRLREAGHRVEVDERDDTVGKRIRDAELEKIPYVIVYGDRESDESLAIRERHGAQSTKSLDELLKDLATL